MAKLHRLLDVDRPKQIICAPLRIAILILATVLAAASAYPNERPNTFASTTSTSSAKIAASNTSQFPVLKGGSSFRLTLAPAQSIWIPSSTSYLLGSNQNNPSNTNSGSQVSVHWAEHNFWDNQNKLLFTAVAASRTLDYFSTLNMRRRGRQEILLTNDIVDNHAAFAAIEAGGTAFSIGASYLFHRYHHHRLERWTSIIHASLATTGAVRNYCLKTAHP